MYSSNLVGMVVPHLSQPPTSRALGRARSRRSTIPVTPSGRGEGHVPDHAVRDNGTLRVTIREAVARPACPRLLSGSAYNGALWAKGWVVMEGCTCT